MRSFFISGEKMKSMMIFYKVKDGLYVNLTNRCTCSCVFCIRKNGDCVYEEKEPLWLEHEPDFAEVKSALEKRDLTAYSEVVFCGYGEPTCALEVLLQTAGYIKQHTDIPVRLNTNGLGSLYNKKSIEPLFKGIIDTVSVSLNAPSKESYNKIVRPFEKDCAFDEMLKFAGNCMQYVKNVVLTTVSSTISREEEMQCRALCDRLGVLYRIREYSSPGEK